MPPHADCVRTSPLPSILTGAALMTAGVFLAATPVLSPQTQEPLEATATLTILVSLIVFVLFALPGFQLVRAGLTRAPLIRVQEGAFLRLPFAMLRERIALGAVGDIALRGVWIILVDGAEPRGKLLSALIGARGLWVPGFLAEGGGASVVALIDAHRPDLINPLRDKP